MLLGDSSRNMDKPQIILHAHKALNYTLFDTKWIPSSAKFVPFGWFPIVTNFALQGFELHIV